ncbi:hypothetical protein B9Z55_008782 [Caenorhabditis nigoni]|uniref:SCP domain-containing protein n=1 Tax=Caenorhabditis nigoni TaxID=1611254 RepID=A0A2G5UP36_9PELO|nr:hypothetical protein B9Z55_008782 [Caenorhabditis nigoni]
MRAVFSIVLIWLFAISASTGVRVKRGLSIEEQNKLLDVLNADRQALGENMGIAFEKLTYNRGFEMTAENFRCGSYSERYVWVPLKVNQHFKEVFAKFGGMDVYSRAFFIPKHTKIGCSKEKTCSHTTNVGEDAGKTKEFWGVCILGPSSEYHRFDDSNTPENNGMPSYEKYGDLLGIQPK